MESGLFDEYSDVELRAIVRENLAGFPEAGALNPSELEAAVCRVMSHSDPSTPPPPSSASGMVRLSDEDIAVFLYHRETEAPSVDDLPLPVGVFPPGWIKDRRLQLDDQCRRWRKAGGGGDDVLRVLLSKIRVDLLAMGYVDVPTEVLKSVEEEEEEQDERKKVLKSVEEEEKEQDERKKAMMALLEKLTIRSPTPTYFMDFI